MFPEETVNWKPPQSWKPKPKSSALVAVELCSGMGGIGTGLRSLGIRVARAYDSWEAAVNVYNWNVGQSIASLCDLLVDQERVVAECRRLGGVDILAAGPPCKGFSKLLNGKHHLQNSHNRVIRIIPEYVARNRPRCVFIENVPDLARHAGGTTLSSLLTRLEAPGTRGLRYEVRSNVYDAAQYGTPQARRRLLILAIRKGENLLPTPGPELSLLYAALRHGHKVPPEMRPYLRMLRDSQDGRLVSARQALSDLPRLGEGQVEKPRAYASRPRSAYQETMRKDGPKTLSNTRTPGVRADTIARLRFIPPGGCARSIPEEHLNGLSRRFGSAYRRLHPDAPSTALSTKYDCVYHYASARSLSVREYARLQGIPDFVEFPEELASRRSSYEMIGNSVPPLLVRAVIGSALKLVK